MAAPTPVDQIRLPRRPVAPGPAVLRRIGFALGLVVFVALVVVLGRDGYTDTTGDPIGLLDAVYYASVTVTTTGYGDITATTPGTRAATIFLITPARILFLILVVSTTVEVLTDQTRQLIATRRWRRAVKDHHVICGYGSVGASAARDLIRRGIDPQSIVLVDQDEQSIERAHEVGLVGILGDATSNEIMRQAAVSLARSVIVAPNRDDTAVLIVLTIRELNPDVHIVVGGRHQENLHLLRQAGADEVIDATAMVGRLLGLGTEAPGAIRVFDDLLDVGRGIELVEVAPTAPDGGGTPLAPEGTTVVAIIRDGKRLSPAETHTATLRDDDRLVVLRDAQN